MLTIKKDFNINGLGSFKIGGTADFYAEVGAKEDLEPLFAEIKKSNKPYFIIGGATNVLFPTKNYPGWIVKINLWKLEATPPTYIADAGIPLAVLVQKTNQDGSSGLQKLAGIPGTLGGAIRGNAGAFGVSIGEKIQKVEIFRPATSTFETFSSGECAFSYRSSVFSQKNALSQNNNLVIVSAEILLEEGDATELEKESALILDSRKNQPYAKHPSVGSVFKNVVISEIENKTARERLLFNYTKDRENKNKPTAGSKKDPPLSIPAGYLVEEAGLKGKRIGGAEVSPEHGNIIVNLGNATAEDVVMLVGIIKTKVRDDLGIQLKEEMTYVG